MKRVLVVDDDDEIRESMVEVLGELGHRAEGAPNGLKALELMRAPPMPCLVLLDLMMPVMDGRSFREAQLSDPTMKDVPVLVISAYRDLQESAKAMGVAGFLPKPVDLDVLLSVVSKYCAK
jgi:CheY-like chemotaxis protein